MFTSSIRNNSHRLMSFQKRFVHDVKVQLKLKVSNVDELKSRLQKFGIQQAGDVVKRERVFYDRVPDSEIYNPSKGELTAEEKSSQVQRSLDQLKQKNDKKWYELTTSDSWLEFVDGKSWICRVAEKNPLTSSSHLDVKRVRRIPKYRILNGEKEIRRELNIQQDVTRPETIQTLEADLASRGIKPFTKITTVETPFNFEKGTQMTLIETNFGYSYAKLQRTCVNATIEATKATQNELADLAKDLKLESTPYLKEDIEEYIYRYRRDTNFESLLKSGVFTEQA